MTIDRSGKQSKIIRDWYKALNPKDRPSGEEEIEETHKTFYFDRGPRARLRRSTGLDDVAQESAVWALVERLNLPDSEDQAVMLVAAALAQVKEDTNDNKSLAYLLGVGPVGKGESGKLSELRFQRLMRSDQLDDFLQQLRRAIAIEGGSIDVAVLAADLFAWSLERRFANRRNGGMKVRWARDYYLKQPDKALILDTSQAQ